MCKNKGLFGGNCDWVIWVAIAIFVMMSMCDDDCGNDDGCLFPKKSSCGCCD